MSNAELGLDQYIKREDEDQFITVRSDVAQNKKRLQVENQSFFKQPAVACWGTTCFRAIDRKKVVEFSWTSDKRHCESELLKSAHAKGVQGVAHFVWYEKLTSIRELRNGMTFPALHPFRNTNGNCSITFSQSLSRSFRAFQRLSVSTSKRQCDVKDENRHKRSRSNNQLSGLRQQGEAGRYSAGADTSLDETDDTTYSKRLFGGLVVSPAGGRLCSFRSVKELLTALAMPSRAIGPCI